MNSKVVKFRKSVVGGFNRSDVIRYIKSLADERNTLRVKLAERRVSEEETYLAARREAYTSHRQEFESAEDLLSALETRHEELGGQIRNLRRHISSAREQFDDESK